VFFEKYQSCSIFSDLDLSQKTATVKTAATGFTSTEQAHRICASICVTLLQFFLFLEERSVLFSDQLTLSAAAECCGCLAGEEELRFTAANT
jgi:hypothetical protein